MLKKVGSPNALMESMHLKHFADEGSRQAMTAAESAAAEATAQQARKAAMREAELGKLAAARADKSMRLRRDEAVHATLLKHQVGAQRDCCLVLYDATAISSLACSCFLAGPEQLCKETRATD
jgi:hypothetical protein